MHSAQCPDSAASIHAVQSPEVYTEHREAASAEKDLACLESKLEFAELFLERRAAIGRCSD